VPPQLSIGAARDDEIQLLYPGRWHTVVGVMTAGKTSLALWQVKAVLADGGHVIYVHFEEPDPGGIIHRLLGIEVNKEVIRKRFHWPEDSTSLWQLGEMAREVARLDDTPCWQCSTESTPPAAPRLGRQRQQFRRRIPQHVFPLTSLGTAVLSLGHAPKRPTGSPSRTATAPPDGSTT